MRKSLNRVELNGVVGEDPQINKSESGAQIIRFPVVTEDVVKSSSGEIKKNIVWHYVVAWYSKPSSEFAKIKKGVWVEIVGMLKSTKYRTKGGDERNFSEIVACRIALPETNH